MPFCTNCGKQFPDDAKFCPECGTPVIKDQAQDQGQRKQEYAGEIRKCPNCGEPLSAFEVKCHACGFELRNVRNSTAVQEFYQRIEEIEARRSKHKTGEVEKSIANVIRNYPIPNTKEDVLEFMMLAASNIDTSVYSTSGNKKNSDEYQARKLVSDAWCATAEQVYHKAEVSFRDDPAFSKIHEIYTKKIANIDSAKKIGVVKGVFCTVFSGIGTILGPKKELAPLLLLPLVMLMGTIPFIGMKWAHNNKERQLEATVVEIQEYIENKDYDAAYIKAQSLYMDDGYSSESTERWDKVREDLIELIETKSGVSYTSGTSSSDKEDTSTSNSLKEVIGETKEVFGEGVDTVKDALKDTFSGLFE